MPSTKTGAGRCLRCGRPHTDAAVGWNVDVRQRQLQGLVCPECQTPGESAEASTKAVLLDYDSAVVGKDRVISMAARSGPGKSAVEASLEPERPYRVVDREFQGWYRRSVDGRFDADRGHARGLEAVTYEELDASRGPLRPVTPPSEEESAVVRAALAGAGGRRRPACW